MFGKKFRKKPAITEPYYVEILPGELDLKNTLIKEAIESSGELKEHWPKATLDELNQFTQSLKQNYVVASGQKIVLEQFRFMINDENDGTYPVGLTWENPVIDLNFDNFVVQTAMSTFNDRDTRLNEQIEYSDIKSAVSQLIDYSIKLTKIEPKDLPVLPTNDQYNNALKNDSDLRIIPAKLIPKTTRINNDPHVKERNKPLPPVNKTSERQVKYVENRQKESVSKRPEGKIDNVNRKHNINNNTNYVEKNVVNHDSQDNITHHVNDGIENIINNIFAKISLKAPQFDSSNIKTNESKSTDSSYVEVEITNRKNDANTFMNSIASELLDATKSKVLSEEGIQKLYLDYKNNVSKLTSSNWQDPVLNEIKIKIENKYKELIQTELDSLQKKYKQALSAENRRHEDELSKIESEKNANERSTENRLNNAKVSEIGQESNNALSIMRQKIDISLNSLEKSFVDELAIYINAKAYELNKDNLETLNNIYEELQSQLEVDEGKLSEEYVKSLAAETKLTQERNAQTNITEIQNKLLNLQKQNTLFEQAANKAKEELSAKNLELQTVNSRLVATSEEAARANARVAEITSEKNQAFNQTMMASVLTQPKSNEVEKTNSSSSGFIKGILVSVLFFVLAGGIAFTVFKVNQANVRADQATAAANSTQKKLESNKSIKQTSESKESNETPKTADDSKADNYFKDLDLSIGMNSLVTYDNYYKNMNLKTSERVLSVGKLLVANNRILDAISLAKANLDHNQELLQYIASQTGSSYSNASE
ncbi:hypothetical protein IV73_GL001078 [Weissella kandleri]|uniref:Uncharacterized protein n=1 Tax=Weissella kandleri TaxID=1616 RepID=A0A0R2JC25_9LACO|nr:hypothetical protein [Weissella kandleri]KRN74801.1 hypothetical protein IV73_GL001078 [Weissella kandleri]